MPSLADSRKTRPTVTRSHRDGAVFATLVLMACSGSTVQAGTTIGEGVAGPDRDVPPPDVSRLEALCGPRLAPPPDPTAAERRRHPDTPTELEADEIIGEGAIGRYRLRGEAMFRRLDQWLVSERLDYHELDGIATVLDPFRYQESGLNLEGRQAQFDLERDLLNVDDATFRLWEEYAHGDATTLRSEPGLTRMTHLRYSTCPPDRELWWMRAEELDLDHEAGEGRARHARVEVAGLPIFYAPYLSFPIDDRRRSGVLPPTIGNSQSDGWMVRVPVYANIAPNYDATLFPTWYQRRGTQLGGQFRYLQPSYEGQISGEYLPNDEQFGEDRWQGRFRQDGELPFDINYSADLNRVSDIEYQRDFSSDLISSSSREVESRADLSRSVRAHTVRAEATHYQSLREDETSPSLRRVPAVTYNFTPDRLYGIQYGLDTEAVRFGLPDGADGDTGNRYHADAAAAYPIRGQAFFLEPAVRLRHTRYDANRDDPGAPEGPTRSLPTFSVDSGLFFERPIQTENQFFMQTLEPRLFYLYTPFEDQDDLPVFNTGERTFTVSQLFSDNRFSGVDRIGDADQVTGAITTRLLDVLEGREYARASIGQVYYRRDRRVTLPGATPDDRRRSDLFAEGEADLPGGVSIRGEVVYDPDAEQQTAGAWRARWQARPAPGSIINLDYRRREERSQPEESLEVTQEQIDASAVARIDTQWSVFTAVQHSLLEDVSLDLAAGFEYRTCCWTVRTTARRYQRGSVGNLEPENAIMFEFDLRGLGSLGDDTESFLRGVVPDYEDTVF